MRLSLVILMQLLDRLNKGLEVNHLIENNLHYDFPSSEDNHVMSLYKTCSVCSCITFVLNQLNVSIKFHG